MASKRKTTTAIVAGVAAVALLLGGTFAWTSISQMAKNEATGVVNVGGRLHDDFNGKNKDVYVENFTDPYNGGQPIYARVKLTEYMEVGKEAGKLNDDGTAYDENRNAASVIDGAAIDDLDSWSIHVPENDCTVCVENGEPCVFHSHWEWTMGGQTTFMPTFNKDKDSLEADINGTYHGTDATDKIYYDDYTEYTTDETNTEKTYSETDTAYYDNDPNMDPNEVEGQYTTKQETHTVKETVDATVITMQEWKDNYNSAPGNYWVYDTDGWAYWANPIMPGEATGLLLTEINMYKNPGEKCYYAINVVGQFATVNDWEQFGVDETDADYPSDDALALLTTASSNIPAVTVTNVSGETLVKRGDTVNFSVTTAVGAVSALATDEYEWVVLNENREVITTSTVVDNGDDTATLTVGAEELSEGLYVAARSKSTGAVGMSAVAMQLYDVTVTPADEATVYAGDTLQFSAYVTDSITGNAENSGVTWSVDSTADSTINEDGVLTVGDNEAGGTVLTVTATSKNGGFTESYTVTVGYKLTLESSGVFAMENGLRVDIKESYYSVDDITATISDDIKTGQYYTPSTQQFNYEVNEDDNGIYLMITHDDENYQFAEHGTRRITVDAAELASTTYDFTCNCHANTSYTVDTGGVTEIDGLTYADDLQVKFMNGDTEVEDQYITWNASTNSGIDGCYLDENRVLHLGDGEYSPYVRITYRTENAWGIKDLRIRYKATDAVKGMYLKFIMKGGDLSEPDETVNYGENRSSYDLGDNWAYLFRVYDANGNVIDQPLNFTIWQGDINITGSPGGYACTNGYDDADHDAEDDEYGSYWIWVPGGNSTKFTFWISYVDGNDEVGTFEATTW